MPTLCSFRVLRSPTCLRSPKFGLKPGSTPSQGCHHPTHAPLTSRQLKRRIHRNAPSKRNCTASAEDRSHETDVVIIGSGIGGLCCGALLSHYGLSVTVCEAHYHAGGAAHGFDIQGYKFDAGPSFHASLSITPSPNPLKQVLDIIGESVPCKRYDRWIVYDDKGDFECVANEAEYKKGILARGGQEALEQWEQLQERMKPLQAGAALLPAMGIRDDVGVVVTAGYFGMRAGWTFAQTGLQAGKLTGPFADVVDEVVTNTWLRQFIDLECFVLSGMLAKDTITAEMAFMFQERNKPESTIDYPMGGSAAIVDALVRGITKRGGRALLRSPVEEVVMEEGRAVGVRLKSSGSGGSAEVIRARKQVVSNASVWDTQKLLPEGTAPEWAQTVSDTPAIESFMHLHLGIDATGLPADLECHHLIVNDWENLDSTQNVSIVSIPTVFDPSLAPEGKAVVHAYTAANEPWEIWEGVKRGTHEYAKLKQERVQGLWKALERVIPDVRERTELELVGTPLTHQRYLRRYKGTYGPAISAANSSFPRATTPVPGLMGCGDSYLPGIGVPAAAASGMIAANTLVSVPEHVKLLTKLSL